MIFSLISIVSYFLVSWNFPWDSIQIHSSISSSYLFDIIYILFFHYILNAKIKVGLSFDKKRFLSLIGVGVFGIVCLVICRQANFNAPFKYVDQIAIQLLILAPLIEELVFRGTFFSLLAKTRLSIIQQGLINSALFSFSHLIALKYLPESFHSFIYFQLAYTFVLGWICFKARLRSNGVVLPIFAHFLFNLIFYVGVKFFGI